VREAGGDDDVPADGRWRRQHRSAEIALPQGRAVGQSQRHQLVGEGRNVHATLGHRGSSVHRGAERDPPDQPTILRAHGLDGALQIDGDDDAVGDHRAGDHPRPCARGHRPASVGKNRPRTFAGRTSVQAIQPWGPPVVGAGHLGGRARERGRQSQDPGRSKTEASIHGRHMDPGVGSASRSK
jgi:hypothetical protein